MMIKDFLETVSFGSVGIVHLATVQLWLASTPLTHIYVPPFLCVNHKYTHLVHGSRVPCYLPVRALFDSVNFPINITV